MYYFIVLFATNPEWYNFIFAVTITVLSLFSAVIGWYVKSVNQKFEDIEKEVTQLELSFQNEIHEQLAHLLNEVKYNITEKNTNLKDDIKHLHHLITMIETRLDDRTKYARAKWSSYNQVLMNVIRFLEKDGFINRDYPLTNMDSTLTDDPRTPHDDITDLY